MRHLRECKKIATVFSCSKCDFVSFRKGNLRAHDIEQHSERDNEDTDNIKEKQVPDTIVVDTQNGEIMIVGSGKHLVMYGLDIECCSTLKNCYDTSFPFEIKSLKVKQDPLLVTGTHEFVLNRINIRKGDNVSLTNILERSKSSDVIMKSLLWKDSVLLLFDKHILIHSITSGDEKCFYF